MCLITSCFGNGWLTCVLLAALFFRLKRNTPRSKNLIVVYPTTSILVQLCWASRGASSVHGCQYEGLHLRTPCSEEAAARSVAHIFLITAAIVECKYLEV